jgi:hypothetical protein
MDFWKDHRSISIIAISCSSGLYGEPASDLDIEIPRGRWKLDSQYRYALQKSPFFDSTEIMGKDEGAARAP